MTTSELDAPAPELAPLAPARRSAQGRGRFLVVVALLCAAVGVLLYKGLLSSLDYYDTVDYVLSHRALVGTENLRLEGVVVRGTVHNTVDGADFSLSGADCRQVRVVNAGTPPTLFRPGIPVVVIGQFSTASSLVFLSNQIEVKHTDNYAAAHPGRVAVPADGC